MAKVYEHLAKVVKCGQIWSHCLKCRRHRVIEKLLPIFSKRSPFDRRSSSRNENGDPTKQPGGDLRHQRTSETHAFSRNQSYSGQFP